MRLADRQNLINRGILQGGSQLYPATLTFTGFPPIQASRRGSLMTASLRAGGFTESAPVVFIIAKADLPLSLDLIPKRTPFLADGMPYRVDGIDSEPSEPQVRITANLASR